MKLKIKHIVAIVIIMIVTIGVSFSISGLRKNTASGGNNLAIVETIEVDAPILSGDAPILVYEEQTVYTTSTVNMRIAASLESEIVEVLEINTELTKIGEEDDWTKILVDGVIYYIKSNFISTEKVEIVIPVVEESAIVESDNQESNITETQDSNIVTGYLTHYGPNCAGCSGNTASGYNVSNTIYYNDAEYGTVRIVAMSKNYPLYSIIRINNYKFGSITAIVLDRGGAIQGNKVDLLCATEAEASQAGVQRDIQIEVLRWGN